MWNQDCADDMFYSFGRFLNVQILFVTLCKDQNTGQIDVSKFLPDCVYNNPVVRATGCQLEISPVTERYYY